MVLQNDYMVQWSTFSHVLRVFFLSLFLNKTSSLLNTKKKMENMKWPKQGKGEFKNRHVVFLLPLKIVFDTKKKKLKRKWNERD